MLTLLAGYALLLRFDVSITLLISILGGLVAGVLALLAYRGASLGAATDR